MAPTCMLCEKEARYNYKFNKALFCKKHSSVGMIDVRSKVCEEKTCLTRASCGFKNQLVRFCNKHKEQGMINLKSKRCIETNCDTIPSFGFPGAKIEYCKLHKKEGMICLNSRKCNFKGCLISASYANPENLSKKYCASHRTPTMINVIQNLCENSNCNKVACFGNIEDRKPKFCAKHKLEGMLDVVNKKCEKCNKNSNFGYAGNKPRFCSSHKLEGMINVTSKKCNYTGCLTTPIFGFSDQKVASKCKKHKEEGMINIIDKKCRYKDCLIRASCGYPGYTSEYCGKHKLPRMKYRSFSYPKEEEKICNYCQNIIHYNEEFCSGCKSYIQLGKTIALKNKELRIKQLLEDDYKFYHDVKVGNIQKRPDFRIPVKNGNIIIEVDEYQHKRKTYPCECEISRMKEIFLACNKPHLLFIRYNPDYYKSIDDINFNTIQRERILLKYLQDRIEKIDFIGLNTVYLFYDGFSINSIEIEHIKI